MEAVYQIDWWELEKGWGQQFSHSTQYDTIEEATKAIIDFNAEKKKKNPSGETPDWYLYYKAPKLVEKS